MKRNLLFDLIVTFVLMLLIINASAAKLILPGNLTTIEEEAFYDDSSLDEIVLPEGIKSIETRAFALSSVKKIYMPKSLVYIAKDAFAGCEYMV